MWSVIQCAFDGETINFGLRNEQLGGFELYETRTILSIKSEECCTKKPVIFSYVSSRRLIVLIDTVVHVFNQEQDLLCSFEISKNIEQIRFVDLREGIILLADSDGCIRLYDIQCQRFIAVFELFENKENHIVAEQSDSRVRLQFLEINILDPTGSAKIETITTDGLFLVTTLQISSTGMTESEKTCFDFTSKFKEVTAACKWETNTYLIATSNRALFHFNAETNLFYSVMKYYPGGEICQLTKAFKGRYLLVRDSAQQLSIFCGVTFLPIWVGFTKAAYFQLLEFDNATECCDIPDAKLACFCQNSVEIFQFPSMELLYRLSVDTQHVWFAHHSNICDLYFIEGHCFDRNNGCGDANSPSTPELRIRRVAEALPETKLSALLNRGKFAEAEEFAQKFQLDVQEVYRKQLCVLLEELSPFNQALGSVELESTFKSLVSVVSCLADKNYILKNCLLAPPASVSLSLRLYYFLQQQVLPAVDDNTYAEQLAFQLNRLTTFVHSNVGENYEMRVKFVQGSALNFVTYLLQEQMISEAYFVWCRHRNEINSEWNDDNIEFFLSSIPAQSSSDQLLEWFDSQLLDDIILSVPSSIVSIAAWLMERSKMMEYQETAHWPMNGISLLRSLQNAYNRIIGHSNILTSSVKTCVDLLQFAVPRDNTTQDYVCLLRNLEKMVQIRDLIGCQISLEEFSGSDKFHVLFRVLDCATSKSEFDRIVEQFAVYYACENLLNISEVLCKYLADMIHLSGVNCWNNQAAPWEEKAIWILTHVHQPAYLEEGILTVLQHAPVPWSEAVNNIYQMSSVLDNPHVFAKQRDYVPVKLLMLKYSMRMLDITVARDVQILLRNILNLSTNPLGDALMIARATEVPDEDVYYMYIKRMLLRENVFELADALGHIDKTAIVSISGQLMSFVKTYSLRLQFMPPHATSDAVECCLYLLRRLADIVCTPEADILQKRLFQLHTLFRDFGIRSVFEELSTPEQCLQLLRETYQGLISDENADAAEVCKRTRRMIHILNLNISHALQTLLSESLRYKCVVSIAYFCKELSHLGSYDSTVLHTLVALLTCAPNVIDIITDITLIASKVATEYKELSKSLRLFHWINIVDDIKWCCETPLSSDDPFKTWKIGPCYQKQGSQVPLEGINTVILRLAKILFSTKSHESLTLQNTYNELCEKLISRGHSEASKFIGEILLRQECMSDDEVCKERFRTVLDGFSRRIIQQAITQKRFDSITVCVLLVGLEAREAFFLVRELIQQCGTNHKLMKNLALVGHIISDDLGQEKIRLQLEKLVSNTDWCIELAACDISFRELLMKAKAQDYERIARQIAINSKAPNGLLRRYCLSFDLEYNTYLKLALDHIMLKPLPSYEENILEDLYRRANYIINEFSDKQLSVVALKEILNTVSPYSYEVIEFILAQLESVSKALQDDDTFNVVRQQQNVVQFLKSYKRRSILIEEESWALDALEGPSVGSIKASERLPFHMLFTKTAWKLLTRELLSDTVRTWLAISSQLNVSADEMRVTALHNVVDRFIKHGGGVTYADVTFIDSVKFLIQDITDFDISLTIIAACFKKLPKGKTKVILARLFIGYTSMVEQSSPIFAHRAKKLENHFTASLIELGCQQVLTDYNIASEDCLSLCSDWKALLEHLVQIAALKNLSGDTNIIYRCIDEIVALVDIDFREICCDLIDSLVNVVSGQVNDCDPDQTMAFNFHLQTAGNETLTRPSFSIFDIDVLKLLHLCRHTPHEYIIPLFSRLIAPDSSLEEQKKLPIYVALLAAYSDEEKSVFLDEHAVEDLLETLRRTFYRSGLQQLGFPLPASFTLDSDNILGLLQNILTYRNHSDEALKYVCHIACELQLYDSDIWRTVLRNAADHRSSELAYNIVAKALASKTRFWAEPQFQRCWELLFSQTPSKIDLWMIVLQCPLPSCIPSTVIEDIDETEASVIAALCGTLLTLHNNSTGDTRSKTILQSSSKTKYSLALSYVYKQHSLLAALPSVKNIIDHMINGHELDN